MTGLLCSPFLQMLRPTSSLPPGFAQSQLQVQNTSQESEWILHHDCTRSHRETTQSFLCSCPFLSLSLLMIVMRYKNVYVNFVSLFLVPHSLLFLMPFSRDQSITEEENDNNPNNLQRKAVSFEWRSLPLLRIVVGLNHAFTHFF